MTTAPRVAVGGLFHETHTFSDVRTTLSEFEAQSLMYGEDIERQTQNARSGISGMFAGGRSHDWSILPTVYAGAMPAGTVAQDAYETLVKDLLDSVEKQLPVDGVLLALHGAMVTEECLDAESDILERVRAVVGQDVPIVVELDMHGNIGQASVDLADVLVSYDTNPHVDAYDRGYECADILKRLLDGEVKPTASSCQLPLILSPQATGTDDLPLRAVHERAREIEQDPKVVCISVMAGFAYSDSPATGASIIVTTDDEPDLAQAYAHELASLLMKLRDSALPAFHLPGQAVKEALESEGGPVILVDSADNIGGGSPGDGTDGLRAMLDNDVQGGVIVLADPEAVAECYDLPVDAEISLTVGAKADNWHGEPVSVTGTVKAVSDGVYECELSDNHFAAFFGNTIRMGRTVWLQVRGISIILTERKVPPFDLAQLRGIGVIPEHQKMIVVKSAVAYRSAYLPIAARVIEMDTAGLCSPNLERFSFQHIRRPIIPLDPVPDWVVR